MRFPCNWREFVNSTQHRTRDIFLAFFVWTRSSSHRCAFPSSTTYSISLSSISRDSRIVWSFGQTKFAHICRTNQFDSFLFFLDTVISFKKFTIAVVVWLVSEVWTSFPEKLRTTSLLMLAPMLVHVWIMLRFGTLPCCSIIDVATGFRNSVSCLVLISKMFAAPRPSVS